MRLRKNDPTGNYWYDTDGVSPASPVLSDGYSTFTPGISEINGNGSRFYLADAQGNSRGLLDAGQGNTDGYNWDAFGNSVSRFGTNPTAFAWNEESGYQTDADSGLKLLGHRYYDSRTGRFLSQDPAGDGDNWYAYADNDPMDETDPSGLSSFFDPSKAGTAPGAGPSAWGDFNSGDPGTYDFFSGGIYSHSVTISAALNAAFTSTSGPMMGAGPAGMGGGMIAAGKLMPGPDGSKFRYDMGEQPHPDMHIYHNGDPKGPETNIDHEGKLRIGTHHGRELKEIPKKMKTGYRSIIKTFLERAGVAAESIEGALDGLTLDIPVVSIFDYSATHRKYYRGIDVTPQM